MHAWQEFLRHLCDDYDRESAAALGLSFTVNAQSVVTQTEAVEFTQEFQQRPSLQLTGIKTWAQPPHARHGRLAGSFWDRFPTLKNLANELGWT